MKKRVSIALFVLGLLGIGLIVFNQLRQKEIMVKATTVITPGDFRLKVENRWDNEGEKSYALIEWDKIKNLTQNGYKAYQFNDEAGTWDTISMNFGKEVKVLNIYPDRADSNVLKKWMDSADIGLGLIKVTPISISNYNANPKGALLDKNGDYKYDVLVFGTWDSNNGKDLNTTSRDETKKFMDSGRGVLFGHDTVWLGLTNFNTFKTDLGITTYATKNNNPWKGELRIGSTKVKVVNNGYLMKYPHELENSVTLTIPYTHSAAQMSGVDTNTKWLEFQAPFGQTSVGSRGNLVKDKTYGTNNHYLLTKGNLGLIQTGHSNGQSTKDEMKILVNTVYNLSQVSFDSYADAQSVKDNVAPEKPVLKDAEGAFDNFTIGIDSLDRGKKYQWYVTADSKDKGLQKSDVVEESIISNIAGYFYVVDQSATSNLTQVVEGYKDSRGRIPKDKYDLYVAPLNSSAVTYKTNSKITGFNGATDANKYVHVVSVDRANNVSEVSTIQIKDLMTEYQVIETYSDDFGNKLQPDKQVIVDKETDYSKKFPGIADYLIDSYQIDTNPSIEATDETIVTIPKLTDNHIVNYVYTKPVKLHARQVILEKNGSIAVPENGKIEVWNTRDELGTDAFSKLKYSVNSGTDEVAFFNIETKKKIGYDFLHLKPHVPSLYQYMGSVVTTSNAPHNVVDKTMNLPVLSLKDGSEYWITIYMEPTIDTGVYLNVVNNHLNVYYSDISSFTVYIDGEKYQDFSVTNKPTVESKVLDIPISEIRNKISVKYLNSDGDIVTVYWNNNWDFVEDSN